MLIEGYILRRDRERHEGSSAVKAGCVFLKRVWGKRREKSVDDSTREFRGDSGKSTVRERGSVVVEMVMWRLEVLERVVVWWWVRFLSIISVCYRVQ